jgi:hypothetical protein
MAPTPATPSSGLPAEPFYRTPLPRHRLIREGLRALADIAIMLGLGGRRSSSSPH